MRVSRQGTISASDIRALRNDIIARAAVAIQEMDISHTDDTARPHDSQ
jgi:hypothetical protein